MRLLKEAYYYCSFLLLAWMLAMIFPLGLLAVVIVINFLHAKDIRG